jgi:hypothetical protein
MRIGKIDLHSGRLVKGATEDNRFAGGKNGYFLPSLAMRSNVTRDSAWTVACGSGCVLAEDGLCARR